MPERLLTFKKRLASIVPTGIRGTVVETTGCAIAVAELPAPIGATVQVARSGGAPLDAEVVGFRDDLTILFPRDHVRGVRRGDSVRLIRTLQELAVGPRLVGRVVDALGQVIDGREPPWLPDRATLDGDPPTATKRPVISEPLPTGVTAIDALLTCGVGQRLGIFSTAGVGKSMSLGMLARATLSDVTVIALIGERGREVNEFIEQQLPKEVRERCIVVVATSDQPAILRIRAAQTAMAIAEYFRDDGRHVLMLMDSLTRFAHAAREVGVAAGESAVDRGFPPSVFAHLPRLVERAGRTNMGSITAFFTILMENEDAEDPIAESVRSYLDGHIVLSRKLASAGHYPAIDILASISRVMKSIVDEEHSAAAESIRKVMDAYHRHEDLIALGAYQIGTNPVVDQAIAMQPRLMEFLKQDAKESRGWDTSKAALLGLAKQLRNETAGS